MNPLVQRLKERKLVQWGLAYLAAAWVLYQLIDGLGSAWGIGTSVLRGVQVALMVGFGVALVLAWYHGERGHQGVSGPELVMIACLLGLGGVGLLLISPDEPDGPAFQPDGVRRLGLALPDTARMAVGTGRPAVALSADGSRLVYVAAHRGRRRLVVRDLRTDGAVAIGRSESAVGPFVSEDGVVAFFRRALLLGAPLDGGTAEVTGGITPVTRGASWWDADSIVVVPSPNSGMIATSREGPSEEEALAMGQSWLTERQASHAWPVVLPEQRGVLHTLADGPEPDTWRVAVWTPEDGERPLIERASQPLYAPSGHILFLRSGAIWAVRFDLRTLETSGEPVMVQAGVLTELDGFGHYALGGDGTLVFAPGEQWEVERRLVWLDRAGTVTPTPVEVGAYTSLSISPEGRRVAVTAAEGSNYDVWVADLERGTRDRRTRDPGEDGSPVWSPDGRHIAIATELFGEPPAVGVLDLTTDSMTLVGEGPPSLSAPTDWTAEGRIYYGYASSGMGLLHAKQDVRSVGADGSDPRPELTSPNDERQAEVSPSGRWIAYVSDESGREEVYVRPVGGGIRVAISTEGGQDPQWGRTTGRLYYREGDAIRSVSVDGEDTAEVSDAELSFGLPPSLFIDGGFNEASWEITADEQRILGLQEVRETAVDELRVVIGFTQELERLLPR